MYEGKIIDTHCHIFPEKIAEKAVKNIGHFYDLSMHGTGRTEQLLSGGREIGVRRYCVHSTATAAKQVRAINAFIAEQIERYPEFFGLITLHPDQTKEEIASEVAFALEHGFKGVKLHPDFQFFNIDEERAFPMYEACEGKLSILFHTGDNRYHYSCPLKLARVAKLFPGLRCIGAHFGGYSEWDEVDCYQEVKNVWFDTCSSLMFLKKEDAERLIRKFGAERFFFGTDFPMWDHKSELQRFLQLDLTETEREKILYLNAEAFYGL